MAVADELDLRQQDALIAFLRALADGELAVEEARCRLSEDPSFDPYDAFRCLQGSRRSRRGWVNAYDVHSWLGGQPHSLASAPLEDVAATLSPHTDQLGELRYEDFLRLALPNSPDNTWLRDVALARCSQTAWCSGDADGRMPPDVAYRLCQLLEREMDMCRRLKFHRKSLRELMVHKDVVLRFLDSQQGVCAGMGGLLAPGAVRCVLVDRLRALTRPQCAALLRRINPSDTCLAAFDTLAKYLTPPPPPLESLLPAGGLGASASAASLAAGRYSDGLSFSGDSTARLAMSPRLGSPRRELSCRRSADLLRHPEVHGGAPYASRAGPTPRLQEPLGPQGPLGGSSPRLARRTPSPTRDGSSGMFTWRSGGGIGPGVIADLDSSSVTPPPAFASPDVCGSGSLKAPAPRGWMPLRGPGPRGSGGLAGSWEADAEAYRDLSPAPRGRRPSPARRSTPLRERSWAWDRSHELPRTPERRSYGLDSTRVPTAADYSQPSPSWDWASASRCSAPWRSSLRDSVSPQRAASLPPHSTAAAAVARATPRPGVTGPADTALGLPPPCTPRATFAEPWPAAEGRERQFKCVLQTMARQAELDAQIEDSKALVPKTCPVEAVFSLLDRTRKGYLSDMDLWQFDQDFGGATSFGSFCSLVSELRMRRQKHEQFAVPGRLWLRDLGLLIFPLGSQEHDAVCTAESDDEAKSVLYLLAHSEPCPTCGMRAQRSADCAGCPSVTCPVCGTSFRCFCVVGDQRGLAPEEEPLPAASRYQLHRLASTAARAADELERDRKKLAHLLAVDMCALSDIFNLITGGRPSFSASDLRRAFYQQGLLPSEHELGLLWRRYARHGSAAVAFPDFTRQLQPCCAGIPL